MLHNNLARLSSLRYSTSNKGTTSYQVTRIVGFGYEHLGFKASIEIVPFKLDYWLSFGLLSNTKRIEHIVVIL